MLLKRRRMEKSTFCWGTVATRTTSRSTGRRWLPPDFRISHWGHIHRPEILLDKKMAYCGSPEPLDKTETGRHGILYGEIDPEIGQVTTLDFIPMAKLRYIPLIVRVTPDTTNTELYLKIAHEIEQRGNDNIFRFKVQGMRDPDISFDLDALKLRFRIADIIDETEPQYDFSALFAEHPSDMIGFYIQALKKPA